MAAEPTTTDAAAAAYDEGQVAPPVDNGKPKNRLSDEEVQWILSRERQEFAPDTSGYPPESVEILNRGTEAFKVLSDSFAEFQEEVRAEYEAKGYVEVDDDYFERREEHRQSMREELADLFDGIDFSGITFSDRWYNNLDEEGEDGEEHSYCNSEEESESEGEEEDDGDSEDEHESEGEEENDGEEDEYEQKGAEDVEEEEVPPGSKST
ncbi:hypothetical protein PR202_ga22454 [Eleusine coracana subsp. coracana]|uniref:Uncharacterized protein n=1 Tax=Eleusine coracana subsp. coracana TaxID=191504 RepID=A0AAV5D1R3_ELECO|nr:hypothetical protein PR202_ga22454 [Eleusine coracana subsp. coracana]